jgi:hypothetical protein
MDEQIEVVGSRKFFHLNVDTFDVKVVNAFSCDGQSDIWYIPNEGLCTIGNTIFDNTQTLRNTARVILNKKDIEQFRLNEKFLKM